MEQAIGALLNLAVSEELREEMGKRGTIKMMMGKMGGLRQVSYWQATNPSEKTVISVVMVTTSVLFIFFLSRRGYRRIYVLMHYTW